MFQDFQTLVLGPSICLVDELPTVGRCYAAGVRIYMAAYKLAAYMHLQRMSGSEQITYNTLRCADLSGVTENRGALRRGIGRRPPPPLAPPPDAPPLAPPSPLGALPPCAA